VARFGITNIPESFQERNVLNLNRSVEVIIIKQLRNFKIPGANERLSEFEIFQKDFHEFLKGRPVLVESTDLDAKWLNPDNKTKPLYRHYQISESAEFTPGTQYTADNLSPGKSNSDIVRVSATINTEGRGSCEIKLNSREDKYIFRNNPLKNGQTVFESNDLVFVNMSDLRERMNRVFTGFISSVKTERTLGDSLRTEITITCEDVLKKLTQTRVNIKPSLNVAESQSQERLWLANRLSNRPPHEILMLILSRAYSDPYTAEGFEARLTDARKRKTPEASAKAVEKLIDEYIPVSTATADGKFEAVKTTPFITVLGSGITVKPVHDVLTKRDTGKGFALPKRIFGFRRVATRGSKKTSADVNLILQRINGNGRKNFLNRVDPDDLAWVVEGTTQPAYQMTYVKEIGLFASEWKSGLAVCNEVAKNINWEFFADETGIVRFRPINVTLPHDFRPNEPFRTTSEIGGSFQDDGRVGSEYWLDPKYIQYESHKKSDIGIFTIAYCYGDRQIAEHFPGTIKGAAVDVQRFLRLGERVAPVITRYNVLEDGACAWYARAHLSRLNANERTGMITYIGDSRLQAGNPVYIPHETRVYYIASVTHNFEVGMSYMTTLNLKYGREPLGTADLRLRLFYETANAQVSDDLRRKRIGEVLADMKRLEQQTILQYQTGKEASLTESAYIRKNEKQLTFQGFIWEVLYPLTYEDLFETLSFDRVARNKKMIAEDAMMQSSEHKAAVKRAARKDPKITSVLGAVQAALSRLANLGESGD